MTGCFKQQSQPRLPNCPTSHRDGSGQGRRQPARPAREPLTARRRGGYFLYPLVLTQPATAARFHKGNSKRIHGSELGGVPLCVHSAPVQEKTH